MFLALFFVYFSEARSLLMLKSTAGNPLRLQTKYFSMCVTRHAELFFGLVNLEFVGCKITCFVVKSNFTRVALKLTR